MSLGYRRLAVLLAFIGFVGGFVWAGTSLETNVSGGLVIGSTFAAVGAIVSLLLGWTVAGFREKR